MITQLSPSGFILVGFTHSGMTRTCGEYPMKYKELWEKGEEDVEQHWFHCKAIWRSKGI